MSPTLLTAALECTDLECELIQLLKEDYGGDPAARLQQPHQHPEWVEILEDCFPGMETCAGTENPEMALWGDGQVVMA